LIALVLMIQIRKEEITILSKTFVMLFYNQPSKKIKRVTKKDYQHAFNALWFHQVGESRRVL
jgi:hypothetical protein